MAPLHTAATDLVRIYESNLQCSSAGNFEVYNIVDINAYSNGVDFNFTTKKIHRSYKKIKLEVLNYNIYKAEIKVSLQLLTAQSGILCRSAVSIYNSGSCRFVHVSTCRMCQFLEFLEGEILARALTCCLGRKFEIVVLQKRQKLSRNDSLKRTSP